MGTTFAIAKKELRIYFTTVTSYALITAFAILTAYLFLVLLSAYAERSAQIMQAQAMQYLEQMNFNDMVITPLFGNVQIFFLMLLPMVTMRLIAEEKKTKTMQLLMTTPVRPVEIVLGKFIAASVVATLMLAVTMAFPVILEVYSGGDGSAPSLDWASILTGYIGLFLMGLSFISIGLFVSSVTESQMVAVGISLVLLLLFWMAGWWGIGKEGLVADIATYISIPTHLDGFARGVLRVQDVVYYASLIVFGLFMTHRMVEAERWN